MIAKEKAKTIREELKKIGYTNKQVSVKSDYCGYSDSIKCTIKDLSVNIEKVKEIANQFKKISRDYFGEILEGANTYIDVEWDWELIKTERDLKLSQAKEIYENRKNGNCVIIEEGIYELVYYPCDNEARLLKRPENYYFSAWNEPVVFDFTGIDLEKVYQKLVKTFIVTGSETRKDFNELVTIDASKKQLKAEITALENKIRHEKQFNRKVEINKILLEKKQILEDFDHGTH